MTEITATMVKDLREKTGAGMMDCKKASNEARAIWKPPSIGCVKKACRPPPRKPAASPPKGLSPSLTGDNKAAVVEVNAETDFVARNEAIPDFALETAKVALETGADVEALKAKAYPGGGRCRKP